MINSWAKLTSHYPWILYLLEIAFLLIVAWATHKLLLGWLRRLAKRTQTTLDDALLGLIDSALRPILILGALDISLNLFELPPKLLTISNRVLYLSILAVALYYATKTAQVLLVYLLSKTSAHESVREPIRFMISVVFAALGVMIVLDNLGISLTAVWTTLGVGGVAIALALQDTLSNFFAGFYLRLDNPIHVGDYVKIDSNHEGFIVQMGWRSTRIKTLPNNIVIVPNTKLASAIITNFSMPEPQNVPLDSRECELRLRS